MSSVPFECRPDWLRLGLIETIEQLARFLTELQFRADDFLLVEPCPVICESGLLDGFLDRLLIVRRIDGLQRTYIDHFLIIALV